MILISCKSPAICSWLAMICAWESQRWLTFISIWAMWSSIIDLYELVLASLKEKVVGGISNISTNLLSLLTCCSSSSPCFFLAWAPTWSLKTHKKYYIKNKYSSEQVIQTCAIKKLCPFLTMFDLCMNIFYNIEETSALTRNMAWVR